MKTVFCKISELIDEKKHCSRISAQFSLKIYLYLNHHLELKHLKTNSIS